LLGYNLKGESPLKVHQFYTESKLRNFTYFIEGNQGHFLIVDPWDGQKCLDFVQSKGGLVKGIINTHEHCDHTQGNALIVKKTQCAVYAHPNGEGKIKEANVFLKEGEKIQVDEDSYLEALDTPGHTFAHLCLLLFEKNNPKAVFTGDTLFNAGVGNCHNGGDPEALYETVEAKLKTLAEDVVVYPGHEYLGNNLGFTLKYEPGNDKAKEWKKKYEGIDWLQAPIATTIKDEFDINTFFRLKEEGLIENLPNGKNYSEQKEVFLTLRELRNKW